MKYFTIPYLTAETMIIIKKNNLEGNDQMGFPQQLIYPLLR